MGSQPRDRLSALPLERLGIDDEGHAAFLGWEKLSVYSSIFEEIIAQDKLFGPALQKVKMVYDSTLQQAMQGQPYHLQQGLAEENARLTSQIERLQSELQALRPKPMPVVAKEATEEPKEEQREPKERKLSTDMKAAAAVFAAARAAVGRREGHEAPKAQEAFLPTEVVQADVCDDEAVERLLVERGLRAASPRRRWSGSGVSALTKTRSLEG